VKRVSAAFVLTTVAAATVALAQQATPQTSAEPPASTTPQEQNAATPPSDPSAGASGQSDKAKKRAQMRDCLTKMQAANPRWPEKDTKDFCDKQLNKFSPQN
jgi:Spy/CpxP family protein refolding chaperone